MSFTGHFHGPQLGSHMKRRRDSEAGKHASIFGSVMSQRCDLGQVTPEDPWALVSSSDERSWRSQDQTGVIDISPPWPLLCDWRLGVPSVSFQ